MYINSAYLNNSQIDKKDKSKPLIVTSCGTYKIYSRPTFYTLRPRGRIDWQLLYIATGKAHFHFNDKETIVQAGHMVLYRPKEPQKYEYHAEDHTEVYWVHFTGGNVTNLLRSYGITDDKKVFYSGSNLEYRTIFRAMINELQTCKDSYPEMLEMYLRQIFIRLQRTFQLSVRHDNDRTLEEIDKAPLISQNIIANRLILMNMQNKIISVSVGLFEILNYTPDVLLCSTSYLNGFITLKYCLKIHLIQSQRFPRL